MKISEVVDIKRTREEVFYWLGDPQRAMMWMTSVSKGEILHQTPEMVGTTFRETVEEDGRGTELQGIITGWTPNERIAFHLSGQYNVVDVEFRLEEIEDGTRLTQNAEVRFKSFTKVLMILMGPKFKRQVTEQSQQELVRLKELCEKDASDGVQ